MSVTENIKVDTTDNQSDETYTTPISPLSPKEKSPVSNEQQEKENTVSEMQSLIQSSNDLTFPLEDSWSFWFFKNDRQCEWKDNLIQITTVSTVENFWSVYNHLQVASRLGQGCDYFLFKTHIQPMWEDRFNRSGGRWSLNLNKSQRATELDKYWLFTLLSLIGDQYTEDAQHVNGCVVSIRSKGDRISLWTKDWKNAEVTKRIGSRFREVADIPRNIPLIFESHEDQESKRGATSKILFRA
ncbi:unnamed protein product [Adineta steineri]|uniref:Eukaryotic translation initiation factor 4E n=1 Tax=Adineta steineri TaxID=433720 RepID=A0A813UDB5_9BILA|nr:unnamed protein product [Adineta steineri]